MSIFGRVVYRQSHRGVVVYRKKDIYVDKVFRSGCLGEYNSYHTF